MSERFNQLAAKHSNLRLRAAVQRRELGSTMNQMFFTSDSLAAKLVVVFWAGPSAV